MKPFAALAAGLLAAACSSPPAVPLEASPDAVLVAQAALPVLNATFPFRVEVNIDPQDPLGTKRVPTSQLVLREQTSAAVGPGPGNDALVQAWVEANALSLVWPEKLLDDQGIIPHSRMASRIEGDWWTGLAREAPGASALVTLSRPGFSADGRQALISALVETNRPPRLEVFYRLEREGGGWVVTSSTTQER